MQKKKLLALVLAFGCMASTLAGCGSNKEAKDSNSSEAVAESTAKEESNDKVSDHEVIRMQSPFRNASGFIDIVHEKYPEINLEIIPYSGQNYTAYVKAQLEADDLPDIYCTTVYAPGRQDLSGKLLDLSGYGFTDNYQEARLREVTENGAIYLLPSYYTCIGITYNKTLLEKNGWELPKSFKELEELAPKVKEAGYQLALNQTQYPGYGFQYMCNILDTDYLNTPGGRQWQSDFLDGKTTVAGSPEMKESFSILDKWRNLGMLNDNGNRSDDVAVRKEFAKGNTLFLLGSNNNFQEDETEDEFGLMPYLSEDGTSNAYILNVSRYIGLNKELGEKGNEQKLEDALHVMEVLSTVEGMQSLNKDYANTSLLPLKDYEVNPNGMYVDIVEDLNNGYTAPFIYDGWDNAIVSMGETMQSYIWGEISLDEAIQKFDDAQALLTDNTSEIYTTVTETLDTDTCAKMVGISFAEETGADLALVSKNKWYKEDPTGDLNKDGVSGELYPLPVTDNEITSVFPTGWNGTIQTVTLTGKRIKELAEQGYEWDGNIYPYELVTKEGFEIADDTTYTAVICGATDEVAEEGCIQDTGVLGLKAAEDYLSQFDSLSAKDIIWK